MERTAVWKWRELKRGEEEINEIIGRAGGQSSEVGPYTGAKRPHTHTHGITTHSCYSMYSTHNHRPPHSHAPAFRSHSVDLRTCEPAVCAGLLGGVVVGRCRGYGDKLRCPVTSIWGGLGLVCRVPLEVICCRISDGLEMGFRARVHASHYREKRGLPRMHAAHKTTDTEA